VCTTLDKTTGCSGDLLAPLRKHLCFPGKIENDLKRALWQDGILRGAGAGRFPDPGNVVLQPRCGGYVNRCLHCVLKVDSFYGWRHPQGAFGWGGDLARWAVVFRQRVVQTFNFNADEVDGNYENLRSPGVLTLVGDGTSPIGLAGSTGCKRVEVQRRYRPGARTRANGANVYGDNTESGGTGSRTCFINDQVPVLINILF
jgi:hypothetical protein